MQYQAKKVLDERPSDPFAKKSEVEKTLIAKQLLQGVCKKYGDDVLLDKDELERQNMEKMEQMKENSPTKQVRNLKTEDIDDCLTKLMKDVRPDQPKTQRVKFENDLKKTQQQAPLINPEFQNSRVNNRWREREKFLQKLKQQKQREKSCD